MLNPVADGLWELNEPLAALGMALGHRMTVARLPDGTLWVHSPVAYRPEIGDALARLGPVGHVVAPNCVHDTYLEGWFAAYPGRRFHGAKGFSKFRPDLKFTDTLGASAPAEWAGVLDQLLVRGMPRVNEVVFHHRASRTLILADLAFNLSGDAMPLLSRVMLRLNGCYGCFAASRLLRTTIRDRAAVRESLDRILAWDFDRIIVGHGRNVDSGGKDLLRDAYRFL
ncbi:MAG TPA: DUF4336 domain-containing protein [Opitutaceae bacterium]|nr:DUF4336 domain-containing protein [Opitutaceae bacterium]HND62934.1 DUF4336 domain-containing protein [Opitutaceae bacterium]